jgi:PAS domain S-box-containing protein
VSERDDETWRASLEAFVDASHDALFSQDVVGRLVVWNRSAERIFGHHAEDVVGEPVLELFPFHVRADIEVLIDAVLGGDRVDHVETEIERRDGMPVPIALSLRLVGDPTGTPHGVVGVAHDLTEQRLAQAALAETEARLREAEALAHAGRWLWDVASGAVQWSEEMHRIHGIDPAHFDGTLDAHLATVHHDDRQPLRDALAVAADGGRPFDVEYRIVRADGAERWLYSRGEPTIGSLGAVVGLRGFAQDVTERADAPLPPAV